LSASFLSASRAFLVLQLSPHRVSLRRSKQETFELRNMYARMTGGSTLHARARTYPLRFK